MDDELWQIVQSLQSKISTNINDIMPVWKNAPEAVSSSGCLLVKGTQWRVIVGWFAVTTSLIWAKKCQYLAWNGISASWYLVILRGDDRINSKIEVSAKDNPNHILIHSEIKDGVLFKFILTLVVCSGESKKVFSQSVIVFFFSETSNVSECFADHSIDW